jgi:peroxiredoxin
LVFRGSFIEETSRAKTSVTRLYEAEIRVLVLETLPTGAHVALLTTTNPQEKGQTKPAADRQAVHLELARIDLKGRLTLDSGGSPPILQPSPPEIEAGCFVELPADKTGATTAWTALESAGPHHWQRTHDETVDGQLCVKLLGNQQSDDWDHPRADRTAWRRQDTVWLSPQTGLAVQYERVIERRDPTGSEPNQSSTARFHLESSLEYPDQLFRDRQAEIDLYQQYAKLADACFREPGPDTPRKLGALAARIVYHCDMQAPTPYRIVLRALQDRLEAAARGDLPPIPPEKEVRQVTAKTVAGPTAPDFAATDLATGESIRLQLLHGRPILLLFYHPRSVSAADMLRFAQSISQNSTPVIGLSVVDESATVLKQRKELKLTFPVVKGTELRSAYGVDATPKIILIDSQGVIRRTFEGWGDETPSMIREELGRIK